MIMRKAGAARARLSESEKGTRVLGAAQKHGHFQMNTSTQIEIAEREKERRGEGTHARMGVRRRMQLAGSAHLKEHQCL